MTWKERLFGIQKKELLPGENPPPSFKDSLKAFRNLPRFLKMVWETNPGMALGNIILRVFQACLPLASLLVGKLIIDEIVLLTQTPGEKDPERLLTYIGIELVIAIVSAVLLRTISLLDSLLGDLFGNKTSVRLMEHAANLDLPQFEDATIYDKLERARRETTNRVVLSSQILYQVQDVITLISLVAGLVVFNPWLILLLVVAVIPSFISDAYFNRWGYSIARNWTPERRELDYLRFIGASNETVKEIKAFGLSEFIQTRFQKVASRYYLVNRRLSILRSIWGTFFSVLGDIGYYIAYVFIALQAIKGLITLGSLTFLTGSFNRLRNVLQGMLFRFSSIAESALYLQDLFDFFEIRPEIVAPPNPRAVPVPISKGFVFEGVGFKYPFSDKYALRDVSFELHAGEKLALVGENGAGKTTLVKLLARLYDPSEGRILLDGVDLREYDPQALRRHIGIIFQDFVRFQLPIRENIAVGNIEELSNQPLIEQAAFQSLANTVIEKLPEGYDQMLGKRFTKGVELSGGEWQKVGLGRAYMRDAQLLILDEPTAALDARAEYEVFQRFSQLTEGKMAVLISHRFSTVRMAHRILVLEKGRMIEIGSHDQLLAKGGIYAELFELQAQGYK